MQGCHAFGLDLERASEPDSIISDHHELKPRVLCQVTILGRHEADELLLLASDGLWDVLSNQEACRSVLGVRPISIKPPPLNFRHCTMFVGPQVPVSTFEAYDSSVTRSVRARAALLIALPSGLLFPGLPAPVCQPNLLRSVLQVPLPGFLLA